jgi:hypothetical protein
MTYARIACVAAGSVAGLWAGACFRPNEETTVVRGLIPAFMIVVGGIVFVGCVEPQRPQYGLLLLPAAISGLWLCESPPLRRFSGSKRSVVQIASVAIPLSLAAVLSYARLL